MEWTLPSTVNMLLDGMTRVRERAPHIIDLACRTLQAFFEGIVPPEGAPQLHPVLIPVLFQPKPRNMPSAVPGNGEPHRCPFSLTCGVVHTVRPQLAPGPQKSCSLLC